MIEKLLAIADGDQRMAHTLFARYGLGCDWLTAIYIGHYHQHQPLTPAVAQYIKDHWND